MFSKLNGSKLGMLCMVIFMMFNLTGCGDPKLPMIVEVHPSETAFVIPLEGNTSSQGKMMSAEYLSQMKVATKRIYLAQTKISTGRLWYEYKWKPTDRVITVDRKPITFVWENKNGDGETNKNDNDINVESRDSIAFGVGISITAHIKEQDAALFLYSFPSGNLRSVLNDSIKSKTSEDLSLLFAQYDLEGTPEIVDENGVVIQKLVEGARQRKGLIVAQSKKNLTEFFAKRGVTIDTFGLIGGLRYDDKQIQKAINDNFQSELDIVNKRNERLAQEEVNDKQIAQSAADLESANNFLQAADSRKQMVQLEVDMINAQARLKWAENWDGKLPLQILPENSNMLMSVK